MKLNQSFLHVYTGDGKGKSTAAMGLAARALGAGHQVYIGQFIKSMKYGEVTLFEKHFADSIQIKQYGRGCFINGDPEPVDIQMAQAGLEDIARALQSGKYNLVVLDEANIALDYGLLDVDSVLKVIAERASHTEVVVTGRRAHRKLLEKADLVSEIKAVKHYHQKGVEAREGIER